MGNDRARTPGDATLRKAEKAQEERDRILDRRRRRIEAADARLTAAKGKLAAAEAEAEKAEAALEAHEYSHLRAADAAARKNLEAARKAHGEAATDRQRVWSRDSEHSWPASRRRN